MAILNFKFSILNCLVCCFIVWVMIGVSVVWAGDYTIAKPSYKMGFSAGPWRPPQLQDRVVVLRRPFERRQGKAIWVRAFVLPGGTGPGLRPSFELHPEGPLLQPLRGERH